jgi:hypothetical protein
MRINEDEGEWVKGNELDPLPHIPHSLALILLVPHTAPKNLPLSLLDRRFNDGPRTSLVEVRPRGRF